MGLPPFLQKHSLPTVVIHPASITYNRRTLRPKEDMQTYLCSQLATPKLNKIHQHLWLAGLQKPARPLHRQRLLQRIITITEDPNEHLVWKESRIHIKPLPSFLLDHDFWEKELCKDEALNKNKVLYKSACGLLLSYAWLVSYESDLRIAHEEGLIPKNIQWSEWVIFIDDFLEHLAQQPTPSVDKRYIYGELRLQRLSSIYRLTPSVVSVHYLVYGYMTSSTWYKEYFSRNFAWLLAVFAYVTVVLSAMQVGLATDLLQANLGFQRASYGFVVASIVVVAMSIGMILLLWATLFCFHLLSTMQYAKRAEKERRGKSTPSA